MWEFFFHSDKKLFSERLFQRHVPTCPRPDPRHVFSRCAGKYRMVACCMQGKGTCMSALAKRLGKARCQACTRLSWEGWGWVGVGWEGRWGGACLFLSTMRRGGCAAACPPPPACLEGRCLGSAKSGSQCWQVVGREGHRERGLHARERQTAPSQSLAQRRREK